MKNRIVAILLVFATLLALVSCSSAISQTETAGVSLSETAAEKKTETEEAMETGPITLPQGFSVGYAKKAANPVAGVGIAGYGNADSRLSQVVLDDIMITCTALSDGKNVFMVFCVDVIYISEDIIDSVAKRLSKKFDGIAIPVENVFINATHTHSAPAVAQPEAPGVAMYMKKFYPALYEVAERALRDLSPSTIQYATVNTEGLNYVRRYVSLDGKTYLGNWPDEMEPTEGRHETDPDTQMQLLRFEREEGKDVVLCNWQCHPCSARIGTENGTFISAEWCGQMRKYVEEKMDVGFAYLQGAAGNLVSSTKIKGEKTNKDYVQKGKELAEVVEKALENTTLLQSGEFKAVRKEVPYTRQTGKAGDNTMYLSALTIGDIAFATVPCEYHDSLGKQVKDESPFKVTFMCAYTNGSHGYIPASYAFELGGYEVNSTRYVRGTGEEMATELLGMLSEIK